MVGIDSEKGGPVTFSANVIPPGNGTFFLEDRITGTFTDLSMYNCTITLKMYLIRVEDGTRITTYKIVN
jgi:hypothetical protein